MANGGQYESRMGAFGDGAHGGDTVGSRMHAASSMQSNVPVGFTPGSILQLPNQIKSMNGMSPSTYSGALPQQAMLRTTTGLGGNGTMNV